MKFAGPVMASFFVELPDFFVGRVNQYQQIAIIGDDVGVCSGIFHRLIVCIR